MHLNICSRCKKQTMLSAKNTVKAVLSGHSKIDKTKNLITNGSLMKAKNIAECSSILQYFWPAWSNNWSLKPTFGHFESGRFSGYSKIDKTKIWTTNGSVMKVKNIAECSTWSILQYFWPALSNNWSLKPIFGHFESGRFRQVLL